MQIPFLNIEPMHKPLRAEAEEVFRRVYSSNWFLLGRELCSFEESYANFSGTKFCAGVSNGLDALIIALKALGINHNHEVIVPSNTFIATALAVSHVGATPVFVEPNIKTYNLDPKLIEEKITRNTKAIIPVHLYGQACEMKEVMQIANNHDLFVIEDNAQSQGASFNGKLTGSWGIASGISFYPGKNLGALGDAGAITTNDENIYKKILQFRNYGSDRKYYHEVIGFNNRMDELQAAFLDLKLRHLLIWNEQRNAIAKEYKNRLESVGDLVLPFTHPLATHVYHLFVVRSKFRDLLKQFLREKGIDTIIHYPTPPHLQKAYASAGYRKGDFSIAEEIANSCLSLPIWPGFGVEEIEYVVETIKTFFKRV